MNNVLVFTDNLSNRVVCFPLATTSCRCSSFVGMIGGEQGVFLAPGCRYVRRRTIYVVMFSLLLY